MHESICKRLQSLMREISSDQSRRDGMSIEPATSLFCKLRRYKERHVS